MAENFKKKKEENELIKRFEHHLNEGSEYFDVDAFEEIINYYLDRGKYNKALEAAKLGVEQFPFSSELMTFNAQILFNLEDLPKALEMVDKALTFHPNDIDTLSLKGTILSQKGENSKAIEVFILALETTEENDEIYYQMGLVYQNMENYSKAIKSFQRSLKLNINNENALYELAYCSNRLMSSFSSFFFLKFSAIAVNYKYSILSK